MATLTGLNSQSSIYSLISQMHQIYMQPVRRVQARQDDLETLKGVYTDVKTKLTALRSVATDLADTISRPLEARAVTSSDTDVITATATTDATLAVHQVKVNQLAKNSTMVSDQKTSAATSIVTALGAGDYTFTITAGSLSEQITVTIAADDTDQDVITNVAYAINSAFGDETYPVTALALDDTSTTTKLVVKSGQTGLDNKLTLTDNTGALLAQLGIDDESVAATDTTGGYIYADSALDADIVVDGVSVERGDNVLDDVITGVTLTLLNAQAEADAAVDLTVAADTDAIKSEINDFIEKYNDAVNYLSSKTATDPDTGLRSALSGQYLYRNLLTNIRTTVADTAATGDSDIQMLAQIGITQANDGTLSISDETELDDALSANMTAVAAIFNAADGIANVIDNLLEPFTQTGGYLDTASTNTTSRIDALDEQIERLEDHAAQKESRLIQQYSKLQEVTALFSGQQNILASFLSTGSV